MHELSTSFSGSMFGLLVAWACSACTTVPLCEMPEYQDQCRAGDGSTESESSMGDGDGDGGSQLPDAPENLTLSYAPIKQFRFTWTAIPGLWAETYQLLERENPEADYVPVGPVTDAMETSLTVPLHLRARASYVVRACNQYGCTDSAAVDVVGMLEAAVGYVKASNSNLEDVFGRHVALSGDGHTLAVGAIWEDSNATGIDGYQVDNSAQYAGAVYVFVRDAQNQWSQQAYIKASNTEWGDEFGWNVALSDDGNTLAVGSWGEDSAATGIDGNQADNTAIDAGAVYVFVRDDQNQWSQQAYVKAFNTHEDDGFGFGGIALSGDGNTLAVGAPKKSSNQLLEVGAVYVFVRNVRSEWSQQAYVKASNLGVGDLFGCSVGLSDDGDTLAVGAWAEDSDETGINPVNEGSNLAPNSGAVYVFLRNEQNTWAQQAYVKASNTNTDDVFGEGLALSGDGHTLAIGAYGEDSNASGIDGDQGNNSFTDAGAVYVFVRNDQNTWSQQAYIKSSNPGVADVFGSNGLALSKDGNTLAVSAMGEASAATGIDGAEINESDDDAGAVYVFLRDEQNQWSQQAYVKASNTGADDLFGREVALSDDGHTLAVGAHGEDSNATGIGGEQLDNSMVDAGAVYLY
jgi:hypothetical protein